MTATVYHIPGIELGEELGRGSFGRVFLGRHLALDLPVAVKVLDRLQRPLDIQRALREGRIMARLDHPNIVRIHDTGSVDGVVYHVLEFLDGGSLEGARRMPPAVLEDVARQLLSALQCVHHARIVHRDIKPANCLRRKADGRVKLGDLGVAASDVTAERTTEALAGTLPFMAPELFEGAAQATPRTDLYALGMTLACLALDEDPYPQGTLGQVLEWIARGARPKVLERRKDLPRALGALIDTLLSLRPEARPQSATEALGLLDDGCCCPPPAAPRGSLPPPEPKVGPWRLGDLLRGGTHWRGYAVVDGRSGLAARLVHLRSTGTLKDASQVVLEAASRASEVEHAGVLEVYDWGAWEGRAYVVTAAQGRGVEDLVRATGPLPEHEAVAFVADLADALAYLHGRGLVFQVVEPGAVNLTADGRRAQLGWPLYCVRAGSLAAPPGGASPRMTVLAHAAPEVFRGAPTIEPAVDLYGLGEVLFYLLAGRRAYPVDSVGELAVSKLGPPPSLTALAPEVTAPTASLAARLLDAEPARRPAAAEVRDALRRIGRRMQGG
ncbi:MAG: protein kinase [Deltaproteobacteria bacterium]|nr:protein kinase [Deltaproteobacteria bacterium]